jgi:hypothetical protein
MPMLHHAFGTLHLARDTITADMLTTQAALLCYVPQHLYYLYRLHMGVLEAAHTTS